MMIIEPWAELGQTKEQFMAYLLDLIEKQIAEAERMLPCSALSPLEASRALCWVLRRLLGLSE